MPEEAPPPGPRKRAWIPFVIAFAALWIVYFALLARQPADRFAGWHNDVAWPADHFMTVAQDGLLFQVFGHAMVATVGTLFIGMLLVALTRGLCRLLRLPDLGQAAARVAMIAVPLWGFAVLKAIPVRVTEIDLAAHRLHVVRFHPILRFPAGKIVLRGEDLAAFELATYEHRQSSTRYLELFAFTGTKEIVKLAERACTGGAESCMTAPTRMSPSLRAGLVARASRRTRPPALAATSWSSPRRGPNEAGRPRQLGSAGFAGAIPTRERLRRILPPPSIARRALAEQTR